MFFSSQSSEIMSYNLYLNVPLVQVNEVWPLYQQISEGAMDIDCQFK